MLPRNLTQWHLRGQKWRRVKFWLRWGVAGVCVWGVGFMWSWSYLLTTKTRGLHSTMTYLAQNNLDFPPSSLQRNISLSNQLRGGKEESLDGSRRECENAASQGQGRRLGSGRASQSQSPYARCVPLPLWPQKHSLTRSWFHLTWPYKLPQNGRKSFMDRWDWKTRMLWNESKHQPDFKVSPLIKLVVTQKKKNVQAWQAAQR